MAEAMVTSEQGALAVVTLDRADAATLSTTRALDRLAAVVPRWARDPEIYAVVVQSAVPGLFPAGDETGKMAALKRADLAGARRALADEAKLCWMLECFSKPSIAVIDGVVSGLGIGLTTYATHRVAGAGYRWRVSDTGQGLIPRHGLALTLARLPDSVGMYLGLTGRAVGRADAIRLGIATHAIGAERHAEIRAGLAEAEPVDPLLDALQEDPGPTDLDEWRQVINACFSAPSFTEIRRRLQSQTGVAGTWAGAVLADLDRRDALALVATHRHVREAGARGLRQTLMMDYRLACGLLAHHEVYSGKPAVLADVTPGMIERLFQPMGTCELVLPTRQEMQAARV